MSTRWAFWLFLVAALALIGIEVAPRILKLDPGSQFVLVLAAGGILGLMAVKWLLPKIGDAVATFFYSSGERIGSEGGSKAAALLAWGDYGGAIAEYERQLEENPRNTLAISEIARIRSERMNDGEGAINFLRTKLEQVTWSEDQAAFLMFRVVEILHLVLKDLPAAQVQLQQILSKFPNTRHAVNARHRLLELREHNPGR